MKRILVYGMTENRGGIEAYLMNYFRILSQKGIIFDFVTEHKKIAYSEEIGQLGGKVYYIPSRRDGLLKHMRGIRTILREHTEYNVIYFNVLSASEVFTVLSAVGMKNVKRIVHSHNNSVKTVGRHRVLRPLLNALADTKLSCSKEASEFMFGKKAVVQGKVQIVNNAININKYLYNEQIRNEVRKEFGIGECFVVGHVGRLCYQKNSLFVLEIFKEVLKRDNNAKLLMVGEGEDRSIVENKIKELGLENSVILTGMRKDVERLLQAMDVFILPSRFEGLPVIVIEAQASDLPIIVSEATPIEAKLTTGFLRCSIKDADTKWADNIMNYKKYYRKDTSEEISLGGYNNILEAEKLEGYLFG